MDFYFDKSIGISSSVLSLTYHNTSGAITMNCRQKDARKIVQTARFFSSIFLSQDAASVSWNGHLEP